MRAGDVRIAARVMRDLDDARPGAVDVMKRLYPHTGRAYVLGITGNPGAGKSTVVDALIDYYRKLGKRVGVVAVDPSSPFSGGAILGDRIRMQRHATDEGVFIRSLATRGHLGGLSRSTSDVVAVLDAMGFDVVIVETRAPEPEAAGFNGPLSERRRRRAYAAVREHVLDRLRRAVDETLAGRGELVERVATRALDPYSAADELVRAITGLPAAK
ncbi:MAG: ATP/GTP-binding protein [Myxococcales bacterium]|nr:ATP/GTP-binding protein [Myxococcales bacterium]